jgi:IPT/TIG domain/Bacterial Ig-like domain (group 2)/Galactose oxidase, central domain
MSLARWKLTPAVAILLTFIFGIRTQAAAPTITSLSVTSGAVGASVTITGTNFGSPQGSGTVKFNGTTATATTWTANSIVTAVPAGATTGNVVVTVSSVASNGVSFTVVAAPSISTLSITTGAVGASVTIAGTNFGSPQGTGTVKFNGTSAAITTWSATSIVTKVPTGATTGNVVVHTSGVDSAGKAFTVVPAPSITSLSISSGAVSASVTITGANFGSTQGGGTVTFNGTTATATTWSATSIVTTVPSGATTGNLVVNASGVASNGKSFAVVPAPSITSLSTSSGPVAAPVTITGTNFGSTQGTSTVMFNGTSATVTSWNSTTIATKVPTGATTGNVVVHASGVDSNGKAFTILATPSITGLSVNSGLIGANVTITGTNFGSPQGISTVKFNGTVATATTWTPTSIVTTVPSGATTGNIVVTVAGVPSAGTNFIVYVTPTITSVSPSSGAIGASVTIAGSNFQANQSNSTITFNGVAAAPTTWTNTQIKAPVPTGATTGNVVVTVDGLASTGKTFTLKPTPTIAGVSPNFGAVGILVSITGTNFGTSQGSGTVTFNGTTATPTSWSPTQISAMVPSGATTGALVVTASGLGVSGGTFTVETVSSIAVTPSSLSLPIGSVQQYIATVTYSDGSKQSLGPNAAWSSSNTSISTISATGVLTAGNSQGQTTVQAAFGSANSSTTVTINGSTFVRVGSLFTARVSHTATLLPNGNVLIVGGEDCEGTCAILSSAELYNPATESFTTTGSLGTAREDHTATLLQNGKVLIAGGDNFQGGGASLASAELYDPATGTFTSTGTMNQSQDFHTATLLNNGTVLIAGGHYFGGGQGGASDNEIYDPVAGTFSATGNFLTTRQGPSSSLLGDGTVLVAGGSDASGNYLGSAEIYNPSTGTFTGTASLNTARLYDAATPLNSGSVFFVGGDYYSTTSLDPVLATSELYDPVAKTFTLSSSMALPRASHTVTLLSGGSVLVVGGQTPVVVDGQPTEVNTGTAEIFNTTSKTFTGAGSLQDPRSDHTATLLNDGTILVVGGFDSSGGVLATAELYTLTSPKPYSLQVTPAAATMTVGGIQQFTAVNNIGSPQTDATWTVSNTSLATISPDGTPVLTAVAPGQVTLTATVGSVSSQAQITILAAGTVPASGTALWSVPPAAGFFPLQLAQAMPSPTGPDLYSIQSSSNGTGAVIQALTRDGRQMWQTSLLVPNASSVPDAFGGLLVTENQTCNQGQTQPMNIADLDPASGQPMWQITAAGFPGLGPGGTTLYCYPDPPQFAVRAATDGAIIISAPGNTSGMAELMEVNGRSGEIIEEPYIPPSSYTSQNGQVVNGYSPIGPPTVDFDGSTYVEYEVRQIAYPPKITSAVLYLLKIAPDNSVTNIQLSSTSADENLFPERIIPDGQGNLLATWVIEPSNPPIPMNPYQAAYVVSGVVTTTYSLPFTPKNFVYGPDGLPVNPSLVLGESGTAFATDGISTGDITNPSLGPKIASFSLASGGVSWAYQVSTASQLSLIGALTGNALELSDSQAGIVQLDAGGNPSSVIGASAGPVQPAWDGSWVTQTASQGTSQFQLPQQTFADSFWAMPAGNLSNNGAAIEQVLTNQTQGTSKQLPDVSDPLCAYGPSVSLPPPPPNPTCGNINAVELLTDMSPDYIFQTYIQTFRPAIVTAQNPKGNNPEMIFSGPGGAPINVTGSGQQLNIALKGIPKLGQGPFSVLTERFDSVNHVISAVTLTGHPLAGWRYWRVYSIGTNDVVIETGAYDQPGPGLKNYAGYFLASSVVSRSWYDYLQFIQNDLHASQGSNLQGTLGGLQVPLYPFDPDVLSEGYWDFPGVYTNYILNNVCQSTSCN